MWVSTSLSSALNLLPHQVRSAFHLSICPPSSRMKRKFPCSAQSGTSSGLARYSFGEGSKDCAEQSSKHAVTKPIARMPLAIRKSRIVFFLRGAHEEIALSSHLPNGRIAGHCISSKRHILRNGRVRLHPLNSAQQQSPD